MMVPGVQGNVIDETAFVAHREVVAAVEVGYAAADLLVARRGLRRLGVRGKGLD